MVVGGLVGLLVVVGGLVSFLVVVGGLVGLLVVVGGLVGLLVVVGGLVGFLVVVVVGGLDGLLVVVVLWVGFEAINGRRVVVVCLALGPPLTFVLINENQNIEILKRHNIDISKHQNFISPELAHIVHRVGGHNDHKAPWRRTCWRSSPQ